MITEKNQIDILEKESTINKLQTFSRKPQKIQCIRWKI